MAVTKTAVDAKLILSVETGENKNGKPVVKNLTFSQIKLGASDEGMYNAGEAVGGLQKHALAGIRRIDVYDLAQSE